MSRIFFFGPQHPITETLIKYPPKGYSVIGGYSDFSGKFVKEYHNTFYVSIKNVLTSMYRTFRFPRIILIPNRQACDAVFTVNALPVTSKPFIVGVETIYHLLGDTYNDPFTALILINFLRKSRLIVAISNASRRSIINYISLFNPDSAKEIAEKIEVIYPAVDPSYANSTSTHKTHDRFWLVHLNTRPFLRGLKVVLDSSVILGNKYDLGLKIKLTPRFVTREVIYVLSRYIPKLKNLNVKVHLKIGNLSRQDLFEHFYSLGDLFVLPTWMDSFGFVFLEAMSTGLLCIGTDIWAIPEIINSHKYLIHLPYKPYLTDPKLEYISTKVLLQKYFNLIDEMHPKVAATLAKKIEYVINNPAESRRMGNIYYRETREGKFSVKEQQNRFKKIYEMLLK